MLRSLTPPALMLAISTILTACADPVRPAPMVRTVLVDRPVPEAAKRPCASPTLLQRGSRNELKSALAKDGTALIECEQRRRLAVEGVP